MLIGQFNPTLGLLIYYGIWLGWLILRFYVAFTILQSHRDLEAEDTKSLKFKNRTPDPLFHRPRANPLDHRRFLFIMGSFFYTQCAIHEFSLITSIFQSILDSRVGFNSGTDKKGNGFFPNLRQSFAVSYHEFFFTEICGKIRPIIFKFFLISSSFIRDM